MDADTQLRTETVQTRSQPMLYVTKTSSMAPDAIGKAMGDAFGALGMFIGQNQIQVAGPPLAVYRDHTDSGVTMDIGFPVAEPDAAKAAGDIRAGKTPSGKALKAVHLGSYDSLRETYAALEAQMEKDGVPMPDRSWEVYLTDPDTTAEAEQVTEIFMPLP